MHGQPVGKSQMVRDTPEPVVVPHDRQGITGYDEYVMGRLAKSGEGIVVGGQHNSVLGATQRQTLVIITLSYTCDREPDPVVKRHNVSNVTPDNARLGENATRRRLVGPFDKESFMTP